MSRIWIVSDTHFAHENIYKFLRADGKTRVRHEFVDAREGDREMIARWNATVRPQDIVYHLGDVAMPWEAIASLRGCQGRLRVILGNHDPAKQRDQKYLWDAGVEKVYGMKRLFDCWLTHAPCHPSTLGGPKVLGNIHGHIHEKESPPGPYFNASVERINYTPIDFEEVRELLKQRALQDKETRMEAHYVRLAQQMEGPKKDVSGV